MSWWRSQTSLWLWLHRLPRPSSPLVWITAVASYLVFLLLPMHSAYRLILNTQTEGSFKSKSDQMLLLLNILQTVSVQFHSFPQPTRRSMISLPLSLQVLPTFLPLLLAPATLLYPKHTRHAPTFRIQYLLLLLSEIFLPNTANPYPALLFIFE